MERCRMKRIYTWVANFVSLACLIPFSTSSSALSGQCNHDQTSSVLVCNYIPEDVDNGTTSVRIEPNANNLFVRNLDFNSESWTGVSHLEFIYSSAAWTIEKSHFTASCFRNLKHLQTLKINIKAKFWLHKEAFVGLDSLKNLDMSECGFLSLTDLFLALDTNKKLPSLERLSISKLNYVQVPVTFDCRLGSFGYAALASKPALKVLDMTYTEFNLITTELPFMPSLEVINMSYSNIARVDYGNRSLFTNFRHICTLDLSLVSMSLLKGDRIVYENIVLDFNLAKTALGPLFSFQHVNVSGIVPRDSSIWVRNCSLTVSEDFDFYSKEILIKRNKIKYMDLDVNCRKYTIPSLRSVHLSENGLQFLHPSIFYCIPNLRYLDLSQNDLQKMSSAKSKLFESMLKGAQNLKTLILSENGIRQLPLQFFYGNNHLETLDLSNNELTQISFDLQNLSLLRIILLRYNKIMFLDSNSIRLLTPIPFIDKGQNNKTKLSIGFHGNPLSCAKCESLHFLSWILESRQTVDYDNTMQCMSEVNTLLDINEETIQKVESICRRKVVIITSISTAGSCITFVIITLTVVYKRRKRLLKTRKQSRALRLLRQGKNQYEFAVFLSYSSLDEEFVRTFVIGRLEEHLRDLINVDRALVCIGDLNLRPGFRVLDETIRCMNRSAVVIIVASYNFCESDYCQNELYQAYHLKKPVILLVKEKLNVNVMTPVMKKLFKQNVRILFEENDETALKNTWTHISKSIIDLIAERL